MRLRKKRLEMILSKLKTHPSPSPRLEQYELTPRAAAEVVLWAWEKGDVEDRSICDLGCGTGRIAIAAALFGARRVVGIDLDEVALRVARENINIAQEASGFEISGRIRLRRGDVSEIRPEELGPIDVVIQNPPFGVQERSSDRIFLQKALEIAPVVYSLHNRGEGVETFIRKYVRQLGGKVLDKKALLMHIPRQFSFHTKPRRLIAADLYRIGRSSYEKET